MKGFPRMVGGRIGDAMYGWVRGNLLVHNTCWDDPRVNLEAMSLARSDHVLMLTSAGCNALAYALAGPARIDAVDANPRQTALLELKMAGIRCLEFDDFFRMFGHGHWPGAVRVYRQTLRDQLSEPSRQFWDRGVELFADPRRSFYYCGAAGSVARWLSIYVNRVLRLGSALRELLDAQSIAEQLWIYRNRLRDRLWTKGLRFAIQRNASLSLLGVAPAQRWQIERDCRNGFAGYVKDRLESVLSRHPLSDNHFWRVYMTGRYTEDCCPSYLQAENFLKLKQGALECIHPHTDSLAGFLRRTSRRYSHIVLLDHMDKLSLDHQPQLREEWQALIARALPHAKCIWRSGGLRTDFVDEISVLYNGSLCELGSLLQYHRELSWELQRRDRAGAYASMFVSELAA